MKKNEKIDLMKLQLKLYCNKYCCMNCVFCYVCNREKYFIFHNEIMNVKILPKNVYVKTTHPDYFILKKNKIVDRCFSFCYLFKLNELSTYAKQDILNVFVVDANNAKYFGQWWLFDMYRFKDDIHNSLHSTELTLERLKELEKEYERRKSI